MRTEEQHITSLLDELLSLLAWAVFLTSAIGCFLGLVPWYEHLVLTCVAFGGWVYSRREALKEIIRSLE